MKTKIYFEHDLKKLKTVFDNTVFNCAKICVVTDKNIAKIYFKNKPISNKVFYYVCSAGENSKSFDTACSLYKFLIENNFSRQDILIAFGGGVIGDLTGFVASTFMRAIRFIQIPTTLLAQTDSSIGNKNAINFNGVKNIIGTFYKPEFIYINTSFLKTLPPLEISNGMAEIIKYSLLDKDFFNYLIEQKNIFKDEKIFMRVLKKSVRIKLNIVKKDKLEKNTRRFLNLGHTLAHALESVSDFSLGHGQAVSLGIIFALYISCLRNLDVSIMKKVIEILKNYALPTKIHCLNKDAVYTKMFCDKKFDNGKINIVLLNDIGNPIICNDISKTQIFEAMDYLIDNKLS